MNALGRVRRRWRFGFVALYALLILSPFFMLPTPARAATASWVDRGHIDFGGHIYHDQYVGDTNWSYKRVDDTDDCDPDEINGFEGKESERADDTSVTYHHRYKGTLSGQCQDEKSSLTLSNVPNNKISFLWADQETIQRADESRYYALDKGLRVFVENEDTCKDTIQAAVGSTTGKLIIRGLRGSDIKSDYSFYPFSNQIKDRGDEPGQGKCNYSNEITITIGKTENAKQPAGTFEKVTKSEADGAACAVSGPISFIVCPVIDLANKLFIKQLEPAVVSMLNNGTLDTSNKNVANAEQVWKQFKALTNIFFVLVFLAIIFSTTLSIGVSNYNVKKMLPRFVLAVIFVQFSWVLIQLAFDVANILAAGIKLLPIFTIHDEARGAIPASSWALSGGIAGIFAVGLVGLDLVIPFLLMLLAATIGIIAVASW